MTTNLTRPEMLLSRFNEFRSLGAKRLADEKRSEKQFLSHMSLSMSVPTTTAVKPVKEEATKPEVESKVTEETKNNEPIVPIPKNKIDDNQMQTSAEKQPAKKTKNAVSSSSSSSSSIAEIPSTTDAANDESAVIAVSTAAVSKIKKRKAVADDDMEGIMSMDGGGMPTVLFGPLGTLSNKDWDPSTEPITKDIMLNNFSLDSYQTLGLRLTVPPQSKRWSINISPSDHCDCTNVLLHFNPRYNTKKGKSLEMNDKQGNWGVSNHRSNLHDLSSMLMGSLELVIQVQERGFSIFCNTRFLNFFPHRRDVRKYSSLRLTIPAFDDNGNPECLVVHKIWWGHQPCTQFEVHAGALAKGMELLKEEIPSGPRTITIEGLPKLERNAFKQLMDLEAPLYVLFEGFGPEIASIVPGGLIGYVTLENVDLVQEAIDQLQGSEIGGHELKLSKWKDVC